MFGFIKLGAAVLDVKVADCAYNAGEILKCAKSAAETGVKVLVFPELAISSYTCGDLFLNKLLIDECEKNIAFIAEESKNYDVFMAIGAPVTVGGNIYNCAIAIMGGKILGVVPKEILPEHGEYFEKRWFKNGSLYSGGHIEYCGTTVPFGNILFKCDNYENLVIGVEICADFWSVIPPSTSYSLLGATVILNLSASPNKAGKPHLRRNKVAAVSDACQCVYAYTSTSVGESTAVCVFDGHAMIAQQGKIIAESQRYAACSTLITAEADLEDIVFSRTKASDFVGKPCLENVTSVIFSFRGEDTVYPDVKPSPSPFGPDTDTDGYYADILNIQTYGLYKRFKHTGSKTAVIGVSGGLDSTLALLAAINCFDKGGIPRKNILGITMPGFGTSGRTKGNATKLMEELGISHREISIEKACLQHFEDIGHNKSILDTTYENAQARERTQILMDIANKEKGIVIGTGDMSELALGWATYNGDHMSMYGVNSGLPKTVIRGLIGWIKDKDMFGGNVSVLLKDILTTPVSPELLPTDKVGEIAQKTEDLVGPYELHDYFLYYLIYKGFSPKKTAFLAIRSFEGVFKEEEIIKWMQIFVKRFFASQFKRSCMPDGPKTLSLSLSQMADLMIPSDVSGALWIKDIPSLGE